MRACKCVYCVCSHDDDDTRSNRAAADETLARTLSSIIKVTLALPESPPPSPPLIVILRLYTRCIQVVRFTYILARHSPCEVFFHAQWRSSQNRLNLVVIFYILSSGGGLLSGRFATGADTMMIYYDVYRTAEFVIFCCSVQQLV